MSPILKVYKNILHHITVNNDGIILTTNNTLFTLEVGENIKDFHPAFISSLPFVLEGTSKSLALPGLSVLSNKAHFYCDVLIKQELDFMSIIFFNYSKSYNEKQRIAQKTNQQLLSKAIDSKVL
jgi:hypothetical protein